MSYETEKPDDLRTSPDYAGLKHCAYEKCKRGFRGDGIYCSDRCFLGDIEELEREIAGMERRGDRSWR